MVKRQKYITFLNSWLQCQACSHGIMCGLHSRWVKKLLVKHQAKLVGYGGNKNTEQPGQVLINEPTC